ncbi:wax ester/triacylglycerol synthase domain-containing protein [Streptomyces sp. NPDC005931]|uniref:wax ester/triacylglycerol synthase domain-containing protein n=1 Tax=Streptomyces sp. NPDC005931 TaxID=3364737 RepID=UPI0036A36C64
MAEKVALTAAEGIHAGNPRVPQTFAVAALFSGGPPDLEALRGRVAARWGPVTRLRRVLPVSRPPLGVGRQRWDVLDHFDPARHVVASADGGDLTDLLAATVSRRLSAGLPPWRLRVVPHIGRDGFALVLTVHHALMDGASAQTLLDRLLDGPSPPAGRNVSSAPVGDHGPTRPGVPTGDTGAARLTLGLLRPSRRLPTGSTRTLPQATWRPLDAGVFAAARNALPGQAVTRTEMVLVAAAGALRAVYGPPEAWAGRPGPVCAGVPVSTRSETGELGNMLSGLRVTLPVTAAHPRARLTACRGVVGALRTEHAQIGTRVLETAGRLGPPALRGLAALQPHIAPIGCTSFRWKQGPWSLEGRPLTRVIMVPALSVAGTCYFVVTECDDALTLCVGAHAPARHARLLAAAFERELAVLAPPESLPVG